MNDGVPPSHGRLRLTRRGLDAGQAQCGIDGDPGDGTSARLGVASVGTRRSFQFGEIPFLVVAPALQQHLERGIGEDRPLNQLHGGRPFQVEQMPAGGEGDEIGG